MLYVTTRNDRETYTCQWALVEDRAKDGGFYVPLRAPFFTEIELNNMKEVPFNQRIADILNRLFQTSLTKWDIDFSIGRKPVKMVHLRHRIIIGEFWHNPDWNYTKLESGLSKLLCKEEGFPSSWLRIVIRGAILAATSLELCKSAGDKIDVSMVSGDFLWPISAVYCRKWGFPIENLVMCCNENKNLWELFCYGQMKTDSVSIPTELPEADISVPAELERLIHYCGGAEETEKYLEASRSGLSYFADGVILSALRDQNYVSVVSSHRVREIISGALSTHRYLLPHGSALAYGGLMDYRAKHGSLNPALVISEYSAGCDLKRITDTLGITADKLQKFME